MIWFYSLVLPSSQRLKSGRLFDFGLKSRPVLTQILEGKWTMTHGLIRWIVLIAAIVVVAPWTTIATAMSVNPIVLDLESFGRNASAQINVTNTQGSDLPIELQVSRVSIDTSGNVNVEPGGEEDFLIFPPQALIPPGETQVFRVQWVGDPAIALSQSYIVTVVQLPVEIPDGTSGIQLLYNFQVVVNVAPPNGVSELSVEKAVVGRDEAGFNRPVLTLKNDGNAHAYLSRAKIRVRQYDSAGDAIWSATLEPEDIAQSMGVGLVQPGRSREFFLPLELPSDTGQIKVNLRYDPR